MDHTSEENKEECYSMNTIPRGLCCIVNNVNFDNTSLPTRTGSDEDARKVEELFRDFLKFDVVLEKDVSKDHFLHILRKLQNANHEFCSAFVLVILSHGDRGGAVYCTDGNLITIKEISEYFTATNCPRLSGKPKLFFIQACRGEQVNEVVGIRREPQSHNIVSMSTGTKDGGGKEVSLSTGTSITTPNCADFVYSFATIDNCVAMRDTQNGSWYITELVNTIREFAQTKDLAFILSQVTDRVSKYIHLGQTQVPEVTLQLRKSLYFFPRSEVIFHSSFSRSYILELTTIASTKCGFSIPSEVTEETSLDISTLNTSTFVQGYCIIINNVYDENNPELKEALSTFENKLNFHVQVYTNITANNMTQLFSSIARVNHEEFNCLVIIVCSEGKKGKHVYGADGVKIRVNDIITTFSLESCPSFENKAKIFLMETMAQETNLPFEIDNDKIKNWHIHSVVNAGEHPNRTFFETFVQSINELTSSFDLLEVLQIAIQHLEDEPHVRIYSYLTGKLTKPLLFSKNDQAAATFTLKGYQLAQKLMMALNVWNHMRLATIECLEEIRDKLKQVCRDVRVSRAGGGATSIVGGVLAVVGLGLIPVTFGGSLALTVVGAVTGVAGGVTSIGAILAKVGIYKAKLKEAEEIIEVDKQLSEQVNELGQKLEKIATELQVAHDNPNVTKEEVIVSLLQGGKLVRMGLAATRVGVSVSHVSKAGSTAAVQGAILAGRITGAAAKGVAVAAVGGVVSVLILPLDIYELVSNAYKLIQNCDSHAVQLLEDQLEHFKQERNDLQIAMESRPSLAKSTPEDVTENKE